MIANVTRFEMEELPSGIVRAKDTFDLPFTNKELVVFDFTTYAPTLLMQVDVNRGKSFPVLNEFVECDDDFARKKLREYIKKYDDKIAFDLLQDMFNHMCFGYTFVQWQHDMSSRNNHATESANLLKYDDYISKFEKEALQAFGNLKNVLKTHFPNEDPIKHTRKLMSTSLVNCQKEALNAICDQGLNMNTMMMFNCNRSDVVSAMKQMTSVWIYEYSVFLKNTPEATNEKLISVAKRIFDFSKDHTNVVFQPGMFIMNIQSS